MNTSNNQKVPLLVSALQGGKTSCIPVWLMRQAGRYLPEYRALREQAGGFLAMVYDPDLASEITMQPIRRFGMDGAILFSDILVIPQALGQSLHFETGEGPRLALLDMAKLDVEKIDDTLSPIYETLKLTRQKLNTEGFGDTTLIGFAGAPWTVAAYMIEGRGSKDFANVKKFAAERPDDFANLLEIISQASIQYLSHQIEAGAQVLQLFDSWAGLLDDANLPDFVISPTKKLISALKAQHPDIPIIGFPRGVSREWLARYGAETGVDGVGCDQNHAPADLQFLQKTVCVQGNLDPEILLGGGAVLDSAIDAILAELAGGPFIFNLGHGVIKETPPEHVDRLVKRVQEYRV